MANINIYVHSRKVGQLKFQSNGQCTLIYDDKWIANGFPLSPALGFNTEHKEYSVVNFLKNIFPEGQALQELLDLNRVSKENIYAILSTIGHDTSGALVFANEIQKVQRNKLRKVTEVELINRLNKNSTRDLILWDGKYRLSVAGVQNKLNVFISKEKEMFLAEGQYSSTHLLKFASQQNPLLTINEFFCMKLAKDIGLNVANTELLTLGKHYALLVQRFDRKIQQDKILKAHVVDGCQIVDLPPAYKYEQNFGSSRDVKDIRDGVSFLHLFEFSKKCSIPLLVKRGILDWLIFNVLIGNSDAHGKNISFLVGKQSYQLAPFYDLLSIVYEAQVNKNIDTGLAMAIGDQFDINQVTAYDLLNLSEVADIPFSQLKNRMFHICNATLDSITNSATIVDGYDGVVKKTASELTQLINARCHQMLEQYKQLDEVRRLLF